MTSKKIFINALTRKAVPRPATGSATSVVTVDLMKKTNIFFPDAHNDPVKMAGLAAAGSTEMIKYIICIMLVALSVSAVQAQAQAQDQDTTCYYGVNNSPSGPAEALLKKEVRKASKNRYKVETHIREDGQWRLLSSETVKVRNKHEYLVREYSDGLNTRIYTRQFTLTPEGLYSFVEVWNNKTIRTGISSTRFPLTLQGTERKFHNNGLLKSESLYQDNQLISNRNWLENGDEYLSDVYYLVSSYPQYKPGTKFQHKYLLEYIRQSGYNLQNLDGVITIGFVVTGEGTIDGVYVAGGIMPGFDEIAAEAVRTLPGEWEPATVGNEQVNCFLTIPINFIQAPNTNYEYLDITFSAFTWMIYW